MVGLVFGPGIGDQQVANDDGENECFYFQGFLPGDIRPIKSFDIVL